MRRVNLLRLQANRDAQVVWTVLEDSYDRERTLQHGANGRAHRISADYLRRASDAMRWTPLTDCKAAVGHPATYRFPRPRAFTTGSAT
jgi:hypothetical protein